MILPEGWVEKHLSDVVEIQRGFDLPHHARRPGPYPVLTSGETCGYHDEGPIKGPGITIGRATNLGRPKWSAVDFWPHNTTMFVKDYKGNNRRWVFHLFENTDLAGFDSGSVQPMLNRNYIAKVPVVVPPLGDQEAIAEVLGALDDKIAANTKLANMADDLAYATYSSATNLGTFVPMSEKLSPLLGGTPPRSEARYWGGSERWISAKDVTGALGNIVLNTEEFITKAATQETKAKPLPRGSVILTARGTVGAVARLGEPSSFNQSCYGFVPDETPESILFFAIRSAADHAKSIAHGSVFDTITKKTFDHLRMPNLSTHASHELESKLAPLLSTVESASRENLHLSSLRDALLPQLMSGKLRVRDAEKMVEEAGV